MGWASKVYQELGALECLQISHCSKYDRLLGFLQVRCTNVMAMAMVMALLMITSEQKLLSILLSRDAADIMIEDFTGSMLFNSDKVVHLGSVTSARLCGLMPVIPDVDIWWTVSLWTLLLALVFSSVNYFACLDFAPVQWVSARVVTICREK